MSVSARSTCTSIRPSTYERHIIIVDIAHRGITIRVKDACFAAAGSVRGDVAIPHNTITRRLRSERHIVVIVGEH
jgi:hypothetical protein